MILSVATLTVSLTSSAFTGGITKIEGEFNISSQVATLGVSLFVLGFAVGPLVWAPLSELCGRRIVFTVTYCMFATFSASGAGSSTPWVLVLLRSMAGTFGSACLTNAAGVIADMFTATERGIAMSLFAAATFLGPVIGPLVGGFLAITKGWRWIMGCLGIFSGLLWILGSVTVPETYSPVLLRRRAHMLSKRTGKVYRSKLDMGQEEVETRPPITEALIRPWALFFREPIVFLLSLYMAVIYGTLYMLFSIYPIIYQGGHGWNPGMGGLPFLGIMVGILLAIVYAFIDHVRYARVEKQHEGFAPPEARLPPCLLAAVLVPAGLFMSAWTSDHSIHWMAGIAAGVPFGFGMVLMFLSVLGYLIDVYTVFAASVLAANSVLRSCFGAAFPHFTDVLCRELGIHWAISVPAFLALCCAPFPFVFYWFGPQIRKRGKFASQAEALLAKSE